MATLCTTLKVITDDIIRILENILWLNTPIDASLISLGILSAPNICDETDIDIEQEIEIYEINYIKYDDSDKYDNNFKYDESPVEILIYNS